MIDNEQTRAMLESLERAAEDALGRDPAFAEALQALKWEIDRDPTVRAAISDLQTRGNKVFNSFVPRIRIRIRTRQGVLALPVAREGGSSQQSSQLTQTLRDAASAVITRSRYRGELDRIVSEAVAGNRSFEGIASQIEDAGNELVICLDLSAYAQVHKPGPQPRAVPSPRAAMALSDPLGRLLSAQDLNFLRELRITTSRD